MQRFSDASGRYRVKFKDLNFVDYDLYQEPGHSFSIFTVRDLILENRDFGYYIAKLSQTLPAKFWKIVRQQKIRPLKTWIKLPTIYPTTFILIDTEFNNISLVYKGESVKLSRFATFFE